MYKYPIFYVDSQSVIALHIYLHTYITTRLAGINDKIIGIKRIKLNIMKRFYEKFRIE